MRTGYRTCFHTLHDEKKSHLFAHSLFYLTHMILSSATNLGQNGPGSNDNEWVLHIPQISNHGASPSDCLVLYQGHSLAGKSYPYAEIQLVYSADPNNWTGIRTSDIVTLMTIKIAILYTEHPRFSTGQRHKNQSYQSENRQDSTK